MNLQKRELTAAEQSAPKVHLLHRRRLRRLCHFQGPDTLALRLLTVGRCTALRFAVNSLGSSRQWNPSWSLYLHLCEGFLLGLDFDALGFGFDRKFSGFSDSLVGRGSERFHGCELGFAGECGCGGYLQWQRVGRWAC